MRLIGVLPIYVAPGGADHSAWPELFQAGLVAGVPPDTSWTPLKVEPLQLQIAPEFANLDLDGMMAAIGVDPNEVYAEAARQMAADDAEQ